MAPPRKEDKVKFVANDAFNDLNELLLAANVSVLYKWLTFC